MEALFGLRPVTRGEVRLHREPFWGRSPRGAIDRGMVYVPEDRQRNGAILALSVADNVTLPSLPRLGHLFLDAVAEREMTRQIIDRLAVKCAGSGQRVADLSGGNQQKVVIGKWLATRPQIIILDEPTKGIDVGSKAAVHALIAELVQGGMSVILVTSELPEILGVADRVVVMSKGRIVRVLARAALDARAIVTAATGVAPGGAPS
jgi:rhamnose transport system ATP-binding protein